MIVFMQYHSSGVLVHEHRSSRITKGVELFDYGDYRIFNFKLPDMIYAYLGIEKWVDDEVRKYTRQIVRKHKAPT